jgi:hypothetical protein
MKNITRNLALASVAALCLGAAPLFAQQEQPAPPSGGDRGGNQGAPGNGGGRGNRQDRGNFDPAQFQQQMQQRMLERIRERLEVNDDAEWKAIEPMVQKVMDLRRDQMMGGMRGAFGGFGMGRGGGPGGQGGQGGPGGGFRFGPEPSAEETALSDAIENGSSKDILKEKMAAFRKAKAAKDAELKSAQDNLKKVLSTKQEAVALEMGLIN